MSKAFALIPTLEPILPKPIIPRVFPANSTPINFFLSHFLSSLRDLWAYGISLAAAIIIPIVCSVAAKVLPVGALTTKIPLLEAASRSMLSTPTPALPTTLSLFALESSSSPTGVPLLVIRASYSGIISRILS